jgi:hypothetical protein
VQEEELKRTQRTKREVKEVQMVSRNERQVVKRLH